ncbi:MAG: VOC family protein [Chloroflexota bacterium]|nr:VOC family protein [Chloroflexota bacterium]
MENMASDASQTPPPWQGVNHVALVTRDLDATMHFYREVLGMELLFSAPSGSLHGRHCGLALGSTAAHGGFLHFFEYAKAPLLSRDEAVLQARVFDPGSTFLSHLSLTLPDERAGHTLQERLAAHGVPMSPIMDQGGLRNLLFLDNNGMALEAAWSTPEL